MSINVLVTGGTGFVAGRLLPLLVKRPETNVFTSVRKSVEISQVGIYEVLTLDGDTDWSEPLADKDIVIHAAGLAHEPNRDESEFYQVNVLGAVNLARQAAKSGVKRFIFLSSIGVNGGMNTAPFKESDTPNPTEPYARSKWKAEQALREVQQETQMDIVILRPPLIYGPKAPGNFGSLVRWVEKGVPLPLGAVHNQRSLVSIDNLVDLINVCIDHPAAANQTFLVSDDQVVSTTELLRLVAMSMGKSPRLIPVPASVLLWAASLVGKKAKGDKLLGSLRVDSSKARNVLGWEPPFTTKEGLCRCFEYTERS